MEYEKFMSIKKAVYMFAFGLEEKVYIGMYVCSVYLTDLVRAIQPDDVSCAFLYGTYVIYSMHTCSFVY